MARLGVPVGGRVKKLRATPLLGRAMKVNKNTNRRTQWETNEATLVGERTSEAGRINSEDRDRSMCLEKDDLITIIDGEFEVTNRQCTE